MQQGYPVKEQLVELGYRQTLFSWVSEATPQTKLKTRCNEQVPGALASLTEKLGEDKFIFWKCRESGIRDLKCQKEHNRDCGHWTAIRKQVQVLVRLHQEKKEQNKD